MRRRWKRMRRCAALVRRDTGESYHGFLTKLAQASGIETPRRADLARIDRKRKKKGSNRRLNRPARFRREDHQNEGGADALGPQSGVCGRPRDGAIVGATVQDADDCDTTT